MWVECKRINGGLFLDLRFRDGGVTRSRYIGKPGPGWVAGQVVTLPPGVGAVDEVLRRLRGLRRPRPGDVLLAVRQYTLL